MRTGVTWSAGRWVSPFGYGGLGLVGTGRGGGGTGEGTIGLGNIGTIGHGSGGGVARTTAQGQERRSANEESKKGRPGRHRQRHRPGAYATKAAIDPNAAMAQEVSLRTLFATTAYFESELRTDADGNASVRSRCPRT